MANPTLPATGTAVSTIPDVDFSDGQGPGDVQRDAVVGQDPFGQYQVGRFSSNAGFVVTPVGSFGGGGMPVTGFDSTVYEPGEVVGTPVLMNDYMSVSPDVAIFEFIELVAMTSAVSGTAGKFDAHFVQTDPGDGPPFANHDPMPSLMDLLGTGSGSYTRFEALDVPDGSDAAIGRAGTAPSSQEGLVYVAWNVPAADVYLVLVAHEQIGAGVLDGETCFVGGRVRAVG